jgi:hypothetical protein
LAGGFNVVFSLEFVRRRFEASNRERLASAVGDVVGAPSTVETTLAIGKPYREILRVCG